MRVLLWVLISFGLQACSTSTSDVRQVMGTADRVKAGAISLSIGAEHIRTSSQGNVRIRQLHHNGDEIVRLAQQVARFYGFDLVDASDGSRQADYYLDLTKAVPDGGACMEWIDSAKGGITYTVSVISFGLIPAKGGHCLVMNAVLFRDDIDGRTLVGEYRSDEGRVSVFAGPNEVDNYRRVVARSDEERILEASIGGLFNRLLADPAFQ